MGGPSPKAKRKYKKRVKTGEPFIDNVPRMPDTPAERKRGKTFPTTLPPSLAPALLELTQALDRYMLLGRQDADLQLLIEKREAASAALIEWNKTI